MSNKLQEVFINLFVGGILVGSFLLGIWFLGSTSDIFKKPEITERETIKETIIATTTPSILYPEFESLPNMKKITLLPRVKSYTPNGNTENYSYKKYFQITGEFSKIYLYVEASFNGAKLTAGQDIYVKFQDYGGHIKNKTLLIPDDSLISRFLYDSENIQYIEDINNPKIEAVSWLDIFNNISKLNKTLRLDVFISSLKETYIEKMELYYQCNINVECYIVEMNQVN